MSSSALLLLIPLLRAPPAVLFDRVLPLLIGRQELRPVRPDDAAEEDPLRPAAVSGVARSRDPLADLDGLGGPPDVGKIEPAGQFHYPPCDLAGLVRDIDRYQTIGDIRGFPTLTEGELRPWGHEFAPSQPEHRELATSPGGMLLVTRLLERQMQSDTPSAAESRVATAVSQDDVPASEERVLLEAVLKKDRKATAEFISRYADPVYGYISQRLAPRGDLVDDLVQEVFLVALQGLDTFAGKSSVLGWLMGIARHKVEDLYRARLREPESFSAMEDGAESGPVSLPEIDGLIDRARAQEKTQRVLARLPEAYSLALLWRYWEEHSAKEMAAQTGKTEKAMERLLARARAHFRRLWESEGP